MKKALFILLSLLFVACGNNGLDKPVTEELTASEIRTNLKKNPQFGDSYELYRALAKWIAIDNLRMAKYGNTTYRQLEDYQNCKYDRDKAEAEYDSLFPNHESFYHQADSIIKYYRSIQPDSLLSLSFKNKSTTGGMFSTSVFYFTATPKKGVIEQFDYDYYFSPKIDGEKNIEDIPYSLLRHGYQTTPIGKETTISDKGNWYGDSFDSISTEQIKRDYDFLYRITNIRYNGNNWLDLSYSVRQIISSKESPSDYQLETVIKDMIEPEFQPYILYYINKCVEVSKSTYPELGKMYDEFYASNGLDLIINGD